MTYGSMPFKNEISAIAVLSVIIGSELYTVEWVGDSDFLVRGVIDRKL